MLARLVIPLTIFLLAGCSRQPNMPQAAAGNPPSSVEAVSRPVEGGPGPEPVAPSPAAANTPVARNSPVVSAEPADPPRPFVEKPSAFETREHALARRRVTTRTISSTDTREEPIVIPAGTRIRVRLAQTLDTRNVRPGDRFGATLDNPILAGNQVIVPRGTPFEGTVEESKSSGRFRGRALLMMRLNSFRLHGTTYRIATAPDTAVSGSHKKRNLVLMGGGPAAGAGIGAVAAGGAGALIGAGVGAVAGTTTAFITGKKNVKLPVETPMVFSLRSNVPLRRS